MHTLSYTDMQSGRHHGIKCLAQVHIDRQEQEVNLQAFVYKTATQSGKPQLPIIYSAVVLTHIKTNKNEFMIVCKVFGNVKLLNVNNTEKL